MNAEDRKSKILQLLRKNGFRSTYQREIILDVILSGKYRDEKEIFYEAHKRNPEIGIATVYRMLATLEDIGIIDRGVKVLEV